MAFLRSIADDPELLEVARKKIEDVLIEFRDARLSMLLVGNGLVCREADGKESSIIRLSTRDGIQIALKAIADHLEQHRGG
jgi:hypothetical protein